MKRYIQLVYMYINLYNILKLFFWRENTHYNISHIANIRDTGAALELIS